MKTRNDFVTNSSSCSYIIAIPADVLNNKDPKEMFGVLYTEQGDRLMKEVGDCKQFFSKGENIPDSIIDMLIGDWPGSPESCNPYDKYLENDPEPDLRLGYDDEEYEAYSAKFDEWEKGWHERKRKLVEYFISENKDKVIMAFEFSDDEGSIESDLRWGFKDSLDRADRHYIMANNG